MENPSIEFKEGMAFETMFPTMFRAWASVEFRGVQLPFSPLACQPLTTRSAHSLRREQNAARALSGNCHLIAGEASVDPADRDVR